ncbi:MAG: HD domain-containing protein [Treponema sp.]|jgi:HD-GYP domain-containing protein (c-di-GMP phosphodiesterase class II)|nr:HD domain-containing protein [Treponema sp.]
MTVRMDKLIKAIATALDIVEGELLGASTHHGKRIASLSAAMGRYLGMDDAVIPGLTASALLHDSALTEYIFSERQGGMNDPAMKLHCTRGQENADALLLHADAKDFVLYHHERADGGGPYGKKAGQYPLGAEIIHIADSIDVANHLQRLPAARLPEIQRYIVGNIGQQYIGSAADAMVSILDEEMLLSLQDDRIMETAGRFIPSWTLDIQEAAIMNLAGLISRIIDYKSVFTQRHSTQIANKAWLMGGYYGYNATVRTQVYLAAAFHDIGKLATPVMILEKPERLTDEEFRAIHEHAHITHELLKDIEGFEQICGWASNHHEKLNGTGYPFGKKADELDFNSRLIACLDVYQAVSEERPYHPGRDHAAAMEILRRMADQGCLDAVIVKDLDEAMEEYSGRDTPPPVVMR